MMPLEGSHTSIHVARLSFIETSQPPMSLLNSAMMAKIADFGNSRNLKREYCHAQNH